MIVDTIHIGRAIPVVAFSFAILIGRSNPNGANPKIFEVVQVLLNAAEVSPMPGVRRLRIIWHTGLPVIARISVGETVGHNQVHDIFGRKSARLAGQRTSRREGIRRTCHASRVSGLKCQVARNCVAERELNKSPVPIWGDLNFSYRCLGAMESEARTL